MAGVALVSPKIPFFDSLGVPLVGGTLDVYLAGTTTRTNTYQDKAQTTLNTNPIVLDSRGECTLWADDTLTYRFVLKNSSGVQQWDVDNVSGQTLSATLVNFTQAGTGAVTRTAQAKMRDVVSVKDFGATGDGVTDDTAAFDAAIAAHSNIYIPPGTYILTSAIDLDADTSLIGHASEDTILRWTGATNGLVSMPAVNSARGTVSGLTLQTSNASGGKAMQFTNGGRGVFFDIQIKFTGSGRWAYGFWGNNFQVSTFHHLRIIQSATVGVHLEYACNALQFFGLEVVGSAGAGTIERAIEMTHTDSLAAAGDLTFEVYFLSGVLQGYFTKALMYTLGASPLMSKYHLENSNAAPTDGADVWLAGSVVNGKFSHMEGGSFADTGTNRNLSITDSQTDTITLSAGMAYATLVGVRYESLTDNCLVTSVIGCSLTTGSAVPSVVNGSDLEFRINGTKRAQINGSGLFLEGTAAAVGGGQLRIGSTVATTIGAAGGAAALPATPLGYLIWYVGPTQVKIPYYTA